MSRKTLTNEIPSGVSMESASYIESNNSPEETSEYIFSSVNDESCRRLSDPKYFFLT